MNFDYLDEGVRTECDIICCCIGCVEQDDGKLYGMGSGSKYSRLSIPFVFIALY